MRPRRPRGARPGALVALAVASCLSATGAPSALAAGGSDAVGLHVVGIQSGTWPTVDVTSVRLWDNGVAWPNIQPAKGTFNWGPLDTAVSTARSRGASVLYVLGSTPTWAATNKRATDLVGPGAPSRPKAMSVWTKWVKAVATRYKGQIAAYQIWNEANLTTFWRGTPSQMVDLTVEAAKIIRKVDRRATIVAASTTMRLTGAFKKFFPSYLKGLKANEWPIDVFSGHFYPPSTGKPADRAGYAALFKKALKKAQAPRRPIWDTEVNFGLAGPGPAFPDVDYDGETAAAYVAQTYLDGPRLGISRAYWYSWGVSLDLLGVQLLPGTEPAAALAATRQWLIDSRLSGCRSSGPLVTCKANGTATGWVVWTTEGAASWPSPGAGQSCDALGRCRAVAAGELLPVGILPQRVVVS